MEKGTFSINKSTVESYKIRHSSGMYLADITIDANGKTGRIQIASDYGDWQYYWGACGCNFKEFLCQLNIEYTAGKFGADKWFDSDSTIKSFKQDVLQHRRDNDITAEKARNLYDEICGLESYGRENEFCNELNDYGCSNLIRFFEYMPDLHYCISPRFKNFWKHIWPVFINQLKNEENEH